MRNRIVKSGENVHHNFKISREISDWSVKYNRSIEDIQTIFNGCGNSIAKTIEILRRENGTSDKGGPSL